MGSSRPEILDEPHILKLTVESTDHLATDLDHFVTSLVRVLFLGLLDVTVAMETPLQPIFSTLQGRFDLGLDAPHIAYWWRSGGGGQYRPPTRRSGGMYLVM
jgi:hypothetical protein